jgi:hypothetical protein
MPAMNTIKEGIYIDPVSMDLAIVYREHWVISSAPYFYYRLAVGYGCNGDLISVYAIPQHYTQKELMKHGWHWCCACD